ncbi:molybdenum cofactor guanylyltransferase [Leeia sp. TBRC 13508]|uniref:Molybdenum cofactor guanylyltransferase n=1 Tax=Leeia speluncae TaxID=2884804 RepID=A0ABS8D874_9NEIS|nr:molybdenum cofactor guanylyltransferase [Leeia speluncae]MCB6184384.1 molybdenum cofactor guanylyltransferase [Leeia speluncae]
MSSNDEAVLALILAGGEGRRMGGADKGLVVRNGQPLIANAIATLKSFFALNSISEHLWISANRNLDHYHTLNVTGIVSDVHDEFLGPMAGLESALGIPNWEWLVCSPCDMPFIHAAVFSQLWHHRVNEGVSIAAIEQDGNERWFPVLTVSHRRAVERLPDLLTSGNRSLMSWIQQVPHQVVNFENTHAFQNCNTKNDLV